MQYIVTRTYYRRMGSSKEIHNAGVLRYVTMTRTNFKPYHNDTYGLSHHIIKSTKPRPLERKLDRSNTII